MTNLTALLWHIQFKGLVRVRMCVSLCYLLFSLHLCLSVCLSPYFLLSIWHSQHYYVSHKYLVEYFYSEKIIWLSGKNSEQFLTRFFLLAFCWHGKCFAVMLLLLLFVFSLSDGCDLNSFWLCSFFWLRDYAWFTFMFRQLQIQLYFPYWPPFFTHSQL